MDPNVLVESLVLHCGAIRRYQPRISAHFKITVRLSLTGKAGNSLLPGQTYQDYDWCYLLQLAWTTGDLDIHDIGLDSQGRSLFVNTLFSCLATVSDSHSFKPLWRPPFISKLAAEDRCHLNGLAMDQGKACYVTSVSQSDVADGWRDRRETGGCVIDVNSNEIILEGLSMLHPPRLYQDKLWLLDSGAGYFGYVDRERGCFERVCFCPGYARGLSFIGDFAVIGLSGVCGCAGFIAGRNCAYPTYRTFRYHNKIQEIRSSEIKSSGFCWNPEPHHPVREPREEMFFNEKDRTLYLDWLREYCEKHGVELLAYCLMTNHIR